jgi:hypothetical protein
VGDWVIIGNWFMNMNEGAHMNPALRAVPAAVSLAATLADRQLGGPAA